MGAAEMSKEAANIAAQIADNSVNLTRFMTSLLHETDRLSISDVPLLAYYFIFRSYDINLAVGT
jgi:hypothetical protein